MSIRDIARDEVATTSPEASVAEVVDIMIDRGVGSVVVTDGRRPVGIVTDRDVVVRGYATDADLSQVPVSDVMSEDLVTTESEVGIYELLRLMAENGVRRVPVVNDGELSGIVTLDDVLILLGMELQSVAHLIRAESPPFETPVERLYDG